MASLADTLEGVAMGKARPMEHEATLEKVVLPAVSVEKEWLLVETQAGGQVSAPLQLAAQMMRAIQIYWTCLAFSMVAYRESL